MKDMTGNISQSTWSQTPANLTVEYHHLESLQRAGLESLQRG